jgi:hypothetical protein
VIPSSCAPQIEHVEAKGFSTSVSKKFALVSSSISHVRLSSHVPIVSTEAKQPLGSYEICLPPRTTRKEEVARKMISIISELSWYRQRNKNFNLNAEELKSAKKLYLLNPSRFSKFRTPNICSVLAESQGQSQREPVSEKTGFEQNTAESLSNLTETGVLGIGKTFR